MRIIVFFDLPTLTSTQQKTYRDFRKFLIKNGFYMMQESVYCRMVHNQSVENGIKSAVRKNRPKEGLVQMLSVTEKQFQKMEFVTGENNNNVLDTDERLTFL